MNRQEIYDKEMKEYAFKNAKDIFEFCQDKKRLKKMAMDFALMCVEFSVFEKQYKKFKKNVDEYGRKGTGEEFLTWMNRYLSFVETNRLKEKKI